jgi:hypothetical protein
MAPTTPTTTPATNGGTAGVESGIEKTSAKFSDTLEWLGFKVVSPDEAFSEALINGFAVVDAKAMDAWFEKHGVSL